MDLDNTLMALYDLAPFSASFLAGILTFLSPCILPLIPPYMSYISGISIERLQGRATMTLDSGVLDSTLHSGLSKMQRFYIILTALMFIAGFCLVFITLSIFASSTLSAFLSSEPVRYIAGAIIIAFGLHFLLRFKWSVLHRIYKIDINHTRFGLLAPFVLGIGFGIGWSPCVGPILTSILTLAIFNPHSALYFMLCYCAGLGLSFLLVAIFVEVALKALKKLSAFLRVIEVIAGVLLIGIGVLIIAQKTDFLVDSMIRGANAI